MSTEYAFTVSTSFVSGLDEDALASEIRTSAIVTALDYISRSGDVCSVWFKATLSDTDVTLLNTLVAAHTGKPIAPAAMLVQIDGPREVDKRPVFTLTAGREGWKTWLTSFGDDVAAGPAGRGKGTPITIEFDGTETFPATKDVYFHFDTPIEIHDGGLLWGGDGAWSYKDFFSFAAEIPATVGTPTGTGNANLTADGFIPATPGTGSHQIDLTTAAPIPQDGGGWSVDDVTGVVYATPPGELSKCMLLPIPMEVIIIPGITMGAKMQAYNVDVYRTDWLHPTWSLKVSATKTTPGAGWLSGWLFAFRPSNLRM